MLGRLFDEGSAQRGGVRRFDGFSAFAFSLAAVLAALGASPGFAQNSSEPPRVEAADPLDPLSVEGGGAGGPAVPTGRPVVRSQDQASREQPAATEAAASANPSPEADTDDVLDSIDLDELKQRLLEQGSAPQREVEPAPPVPGRKVVLRGLDKMTGYLSETEALVGETASLWRLKIDVKACFSRVEASQSAAGSAFLQIHDTKNDKEEQVFSGWMFAASPALSAMDHPRYDVWVLSCTTS